jgi:hypothetical protein
LSLPRDKVRPSGYFGDAEISIACQVWQGSWDQNRADFVGSFAERAACAEARPVCPDPAAVDERQRLLLGFRRNDGFRSRRLLGGGGFLESFFRFLFLLFHFPLSLFVLIVRFQYWAPRWLVL